MLKLSLMFIIQINQLSRELSMYRNMYQTDVNDAVWSILQLYIPQEKPGGRPRDTDIRQVINGILYVLNNDCSWRKIPDDLLPWQTVYDYYHKWRKNGIWDKLSSILIQYQMLDEVHSPEMLAKVS